LANKVGWVALQDARLPNSNAPALLIKRRTLTRTLDAEQQATALHRKSEFDFAPGTNLVTLTGANYRGLGGFRSILGGDASGSKRANLTTQMLTFDMSWRPLGGNKFA
jgi:hypothetical protein